MSNAASNTNTTKRKLKAPNCRAIAEQAGGAVLEQYNREGLTTYREVIVLPSGQELVREGYLESTRLPDGTMLHKKKQTSLLTRAQAEEE